MKTEITLAIPHEPPKNLKDIASCLFWREPALVPVACDFLTSIKNWGRTETPYQTNQWKTYCERAGISQSQYSNMLKRLRTAGIIEKRYNKVKKAHELTLSTSFPKKLQALYSSWQQFSHT